MVESAIVAQAFALVRVLRQVTVSQLQQCAQMKHDIVSYLYILDTYRACQQDLQLVVELIGHQTLFAANALFDVAFFKLLRLCVRRRHRAILRIQLAVVRISLLINYGGNVIQYFVII